MEAEQTYSLRTKAYTGIIRVLACSPWHAKQKAAMLYGIIEPDPAKYSILPKLNKTPKRD